MTLVQRIHEASGLGRPQPDNPIHSLDRDLLAGTRLGRALGLDDGVLIRLSRLYGENLRRIAQAGLPPAHVGLHAGPVVFQDGDYFGRTVNLAARIAAPAGPGQVLG